MKGINQENLILGKQAFDRAEIEKRMIAGGFNSLSKFELFIWDLEMFLQLQNKLGDKIILKGGAATQFYIPVEAQRTSIDIDMICLATREEARNAIREIESQFNGEGEYCKFIFHEPKNPKVGLDVLETFYQTVPSVCDYNELYDKNGVQKVKIEFMYSERPHVINKMKTPELFALQTDERFNLITFESLFADKLTTLGPTTIGISDEREDEQFKQIYDVITLLQNNLEYVFQNRDLILENYVIVAKEECQIHGIQYDPESLFADMILLMRRLQNIENDSHLQRRSNDFQSLYLRNEVSRDKVRWAIVGYQLEMLAMFVFLGDSKILQFREIEETLNQLRFEKIRGPERGERIKEVRNVLETKFGTIENLSENIFKKPLDRMIWELAMKASIDDINDSIRNVLMT